MLNSREKILILGPSQVGKSTLFRSLVKEKDVKRFSYPASSILFPYGTLRIRNKRYDLVDAPAISTLIPTTEDESAVLKFILNEPVSRVILVVDETTIHDNLLLLIQLSELQIPFVVAIYKKTGFSVHKDIVDTEKIASLCNTRVITITPLLNIGIPELKKSLTIVSSPRWVGSYKPEIEGILLNLETLLQAQIKTRVSLRFVALGLILNCQNLRQFVRETLPEKNWLRVLHYLKKIHSLNNAFYVANRIGEIQEEISIQIELSPKERGKEPTPISPKHVSFLKGGTTFSLLAIIALWYFLVLKVGGDWLVSLLYNHFVGKYLEPALTSFVALFNSHFLQEFLIGKYGIVTIWFTYSFAIILPTLTIFFVIFAVLNETGLFTRMAVLFNSFLRRIGLSGFSLSIIALSSSCKVISFLKTKLLGNAHERRIIMTVSLLSIPCIAQAIILSLTLGLLPWPLILLFLIIIFGQVFAASFVLKSRAASPDFIVPITPIVYPGVKKTLSKSWNYLFWYIREATPLLLVGNIILFSLSFSGLLEPIKDFLSPLFVSGLNLPRSFTDAAFFGLFRKDLGAIFLYDLVNTGEMNSIQLFVSLIFLMTSIPCIGVILVLINRRGLFYGLRVTMISLMYSYSLAYTLNWVLRL